MDEMGFSPVPWIQLGPLYYYISISGYNKGCVENVIKQMSHLYVQIYQMALQFILMHLET